MRAIRPTILRMQGYSPGEQPRDRGYVKLNTNENPYPPAPEVLAAIRDALGADLRLYPDPAATDLRREAAALYGVTPDHVLAGNGSDELLALLARACVGPGDRVAYPVPTYSLYDTMVAVEDGVAVRIPFGGDFRLPADLAAARARLTFICNPNSPSGTLAPGSEIDKLAGVVDGLLVIDEAYADFAGESALPLVARHENLIVLRTLSKSYSLAGMRVGLLVGAPAVIAEIMKVKDSYNLNRLSIVAGAAALRDQAWMRANVSRIQATRARLTTALRALAYEVPGSHANFVLARRPGIRQEQAYLALKERGILVRYFETDGLDDSLRITVGTDAEVDSLLSALAEIVAR